MKNHERNGLPLQNLTTIALSLWSGVMAMAGLLPLDNFVGHPHWDRIAWTIATRHWRSPNFYFDVLANIVLFYPFGLLLARRFPPHRWTHTLRLIGFGLALSFGIEFFQIYCHNRQPSAIDLLSNTSGTALGVLSSRLVFSYPLFDACLPRPHSHPTGS